MKEAQPNLSLDIEAFDYELPEDAVALHPVTPRSRARLLHQSNGKVSTGWTFQDLPRILPQGMQLWVNDTQVIRARLLLLKPTGGRLELFLLEPQGMAMEQALQSTGPVIWKCLVRGAKRWSSGEAGLKVMTPEGLWEIQAHLKVIEEGTRQVELQWKRSSEGTMEAPSLAMLLDVLGNMPLPPYMRRPDEERDATDYQTVYAEVPGSVAAPTAGLHYDQELMEELRSVGTIHSVTLHVGAGTFKPLTEGPVVEHAMHAEFCMVGNEALQALSRDDVHRVATGTTTLRTLESLYWLAIKWKVEGKRPVRLDQWEWAQELRQPSLELAWNMQEAMHWVLQELQGEDWSFETAIMIIPSYTIRSCQGLITNFHLPKSTLLCLVAVAMGDQWKEVYAQALESGFRFLSYGDGSYLDFGTKKAR